MSEKVLVVGSGPVGLTMALELARYGIDVRLVDKMTARGTTSRALGIWSRTLELLDRAGISADLVAAGNRVNAANIVAGDEPIAHMSLHDVASPYPFLLILPQSDTEAVLERHVERLGVRTEMGVELAGFSQDTDGVTARLRHADGREETERFSWLVGCDGAHSTVRHALGLAFQGDTIDEDWVLGDFHMAGYPFPVDEIATYWHQDGPIVFFPIGPDRFRIIGSLGPSTGAMPAAPSTEAFQALIDHRGPGGITLKGALWISVFRINERQVPTYRQGRVFLAGDAAHVHSPAGGQGMNTGMQDAINLAWKLALDCRGLARTPMLLDSYDAERREVGADVIAAAGRMTSLIMVRNPVGQHIRNAVLHVVLGLKPVQHALEGVMTETAIHYGASPLNGPAAGSAHKPGSRIAPVPGEAPYGAGGTPLFTVCSDASVVKPASAAFSGLVDPVTRPGVPGLGIALVRPDGYLAMSAPPGGWAAIETYLDRLMSPPTAGPETVLSGGGPI